jgi:retron-type reverse transcriptase
MTPFERLKQVLKLGPTPRKKAGAAERVPSKAEPPKPAAVLQLDGSAYLPITTDELREQLEALIAERGFEFAGTGTLPLDDEQAQLINRGMIAEGLLPPEQVAEIEQIARDHDRLQRALRKIDPQAEEHAGTAAVTADRAARAALKASKKAAAAARQQAHTEAVAHRKATDIVYLGAGVSKALARKESAADQLTARGLPVLHTAADLATALNVSVPRLRWLAYHTEVATRVHYVYFTIPKKSGGTRTLSAPHRSLAAAQEWICTHILNRLPVEPAAQGFVPGRSIVTNATPHVGQAVVINLDLASFFPGIHWPRVYATFRRLGYSGQVASLLALLCTECPRTAVEYAGVKYFVATGPRGLPQGACTSPALSNQVARRLDQRLQGLANKFHLAYTRYADDLTFSGGPEINARVGYLLARVRQITTDAGFTLHPDKTRVQRPNMAQTVTGLVVNAKPTVARTELRQLRAILHRAKTEGLAAQNREQRPHFVAWLRGKIAFVNMTRPELAQTMLRELETLVGKA